MYKKKKHCKSVFYSCSVFIIYGLFTVPLPVIDNSPLMLITGLTGMKSVLAGLKAITDKDTIAKGLNAAATWLQAKAENNLQKEKGESKVATAADTKETNKNTGSKIANGVAGKKGGGTGSKVPSGTGGGAGGTSLKGAVSNFGKSLGSLAKSYGAVAAGIAIVVGTIALAIHQYNKAANEAKSAAEAANEAA